MWSPAVLYMLDWMRPCWYMPSLVQPLGNCACTCSCSWAHQVIIFCQQLPHGMLPQHLTRHQHLPHALLCRKLLHPGNLCCLKRNCIILVPPLPSCCCCAATDDTCNYSRSPRVSGKVQDQLPSTCCTTQCSRCYTAPEEVWVSGTIPCCSLLVASEAPATPGTPETA
jgi:hypothetical protein